MLNPDWYSILRDPHTETSKGGQPEINGKIKGEKKLWQPADAALQLEAHGSSGWERGESMWQQVLSLAWRSKELGEGGAAQQGKQ